MKNLITSLLVLMLRSAFCQETPAQPNRLPTFGLYKRARLIPIDQALNSIGDSVTLADSV